MMKHTILIAAVFAFCAATVAAQCGTTISTFPYTENFDGSTTNGTQTPPAGWTQDQTDVTGTDDDWYFRNQPTPSAGVGPNADHTTGVPGSGYYAHVEDSGGSYAAVNLITPCFDFTSLSNPELRFWAHMNDTNGGTNQNMLHIDVIAGPMNTVTADVITPIANVGPNWVLYQADLTAFAGQNDVRVQFRGTSNGGSFTHDVAIDDVEVRNADQIDLAVVSIDAPATITTCGVGLGATELVTISIRNFGVLAVPAMTPVPVSFSVDAGTPVMETFMPPMGIPAFGTVQYTFAATGDFSAPGLHVTTATVSFADPVPGNDSLTMNINSGIPFTITQFPYLEDFDNYNATNATQTPPPCWSNDPVDGGGTGPSEWQFFNQQANGTAGPTADHTTGITGQGFFGLVDGLTGNQPAVNLETAQFDLGFTSVPSLRFWVFSNNGNMNTAVGENGLALDVIEVSSGMTFNDVRPEIGHVGPMWTEQLVNLSQFTGSVIRIRFRARTNSGNLHDLAIDDFEIFDGMTGGGQPAQTGAAIMDINNALDAFGFPVSPGGPGPHFASTTPGGSIAFTFEGEPGQPIVLLGGPLNVGITSFGAVGQFDIGMLPLAGGLPSALTLYADGTNPVGFFNLLFRIGASGKFSITFPTPGLPVGVFTTFQAAIVNSVTFVRMSNAVELSVM